MSSIKKPKEFSLSSIQTKGSKTVVSWIDDGNEISKTSSLPIHPDFTELLSKCMDTLADYNKSPDMVDNLYFKKCTVKNYSDEEGQSVHITGTFKHPESLQKTGWTTSKIQTHGEKYGFENDLKICVEDLAVEACAYVFDKKTNQSEMDFDEAES